MEVVRIKATTLGVTGSATGIVTSSNHVSGRVAAIHIGVETGGTADITISMARDATTEEIVTLSAVTSSDWYYPRKQVCNSAGLLSYSVGGPYLEPYVVSDQLTMNITNATTDKTFTASIYVET
jgi:hypothetical protein